MSTEEHKEASKTRVIKSVKNRKRSIVIFLVLPVVLTILFPLGGLPYLCGRFIPYTGALLYTCMLYPITCIFIIYCLYRGISIRFGKSRERTAKSQIASVAEISIPLVFILSFLVSILTSVKGMTVLDKPFMSGLQARMKGKADIEAIRDWLQSLDKEDYDSIDNSYNAFSRNRSEWPKALRALKPGRVLLSADDNGNAKVRPMWSYGPIAGSWGIEIGTENMKVPPSDFSMYGEYRLSVEPGVYVWRGLE
jgi:hypothetical protein